jgi:hypothetical protein
MVTVARTARSKKQRQFVHPQVLDGLCLLGRTSFAGYCCALSASARVHYAFKTLAYTMLNLRHYCQI